MHEHGRSDGLLQNIFAATLIDHCDYDLIIVITIGSVMFDRQQVESAIKSQMQGVMGAQQIDAMTDRFKDSGSSTIASVVDIVLLLFAATGVLAQLQTTLNRVLGCRP